MKKKIWFAILLIVVAVLIVLGSLGVFQPFTAGQVALLAFMGLLIIGGLKGLWFGGIFIPLGILYINFYGKLNLPFIGIWPTIGIIICLSIALDIIFEPLRKKIFKGHFHGDRIKGTATTETSSSSTFSEKVKCANKVKYINAENFERGEASVDLGKLDIYLNNAQVPSKSCSVNVFVRMGTFELFIPSNWIVVDAIEKTMSSLDDNEHQMKQANLETEPVTLTLTGSITMGNMVIHRI